MSLPEDLPPESRREFMRKSFARLFRAGQEATGAAPEPPPRAPARPLNAMPVAPPSGSVPHGAGNAETPTTEAEPAPPRSTGPIYLNAREEMRYEPLGRARWMVSRISFGAATFRGVEGDPVNMALERGVNLIDTALNYGDSETALARVIQPVRDKFWLSSKTPPIDAALREIMSRREPPPHESEASVRGEAAAQFFNESLDSSLARLATPMIDIYSVQNVETPETVRAPEFAAAIERAKAQGKIKLAGLTTIRNVRATLDAAIECGVFDVVFVPIHPLNITWMLPFFDKARLKGVGMIGMMSTISLPPLAGELDLEYDTIPEGTNAWQLTHLYVLRNAPVASLVTSMSKPERVEQNAFLGGIDTGVFMGNEIDGIVYEDFWPVCQVCRRQGHIDDAALEMAYQARYRRYDTSGYPAALNPTLDPYEYLTVCSECAAKE